MLKLTLRRFAVLGLVAALSSSTGVAMAQLVPTPSTPRLDTPRSNDAEPEADSRAGGALSQDADPVDGADIVTEEDARAAIAEDLDEAAPGDQGGPDALGPDGVIDIEGDDLELGEAETTTFVGPVTAVSANTITVQLSPPRVAVATKQTFKVAPNAAVMVDGRRSSLAKIKKGSTVRVISLAGDPEVAARIFVGTAAAQRPSAREAAAGGPERMKPAVDVGEASDAEDVDQNFDVYPDRDSAPTPPRKPDESRVAGRNIGGEEAVLPLGIEVYGHGPSGALVTEMMSGGPAAEAGLLIGDLMIGVNNQPIPDPELIEQLMVSEDGTAPVELTVMRNGQQLQFAVHPAEILDNGLVTQDAIQQALVGHGVVGGGADAVLPLGAAGFNDFANGGVTITGERDALLGGLLPNDVILGVNGQPIRNRAALLESLRGLPGDADAFDLEVLRNGQRSTLNVPANALGTGFRGRNVNTGGVNAPATSPSGAVRPGRSAAANPGATSSGRSAARQGSITSGRSGAAPGNTTPSNQGAGTPATQTPATGTGGQTGGTTGGAGQTGTTDVPQ